MRSWTERFTSRNIEHTQDEEIRDLFVGKSVKVVNQDDGYLELSDGTLIEIEGNLGCGGCSAGNYSLTDLNECENIITSVTVEEETRCPGYCSAGDPECDCYEPDRVYRLFVFAENKKLNLATIEGNDGNGYYGSGFTIYVKGKSS